MTDALDMAVRPIRRETVRALAGIAREALARAVARRPAVEIAAAILVRAPNAGRRIAAPVAGEWRVPVGASRYTDREASSSAARGASCDTSVGSSGRRAEAVLSVRVVSPAAQGRPPRGTVFVLHGVRDSQATMGEWAALLTREGYRAVLVDSRGHGRSTGSALTYGVEEARDLGAVLDFVAAREGPLGPIGAMGHSYGAATAILWAGIEPRVRAVVAVSPFASLRAVVPGYLPLKLPADFARRIVDAAGRIAHFDPDLASPLDAAARTSAALLVVHGKKDARIPFAQAQQIVAAAKGPSELVLVAGAHHDNVAGATGTRLAERAAAWFRRYLA
jgi:alpha-beta hydrolase superfamily lysophospholipase